MKKREIDNNAKKKGNREQYKKRKQTVMPKIYGNRQ